MELIKQLEQLIGKTVTNLGAAESIPVSVRGS